MKDVGGLAAPFGPPRPVGTAPPERSPGHEGRAAEPGRADVSLPEVFPSRDPDFGDDLDLDDDFDVPSFLK